MRLPQNTKTVRKTAAFLCLILAPLAPVAPVARVVSARAASEASEPALTDDRPLLRMDLRDHGYVPSLNGLGDSLSLAFTETNDLVFAWTTLDKPARDKKKGPVFPAPSHLHALVLDPRTGHKRNAKQWPTAAFDATIDPVAKESFILCTGSALQLLSRDLDVIREQPLRRPAWCRGNRVSPSGRSFSTNTSVGKDYQRTLIDAESLQPLATWSNEARNVDFTDALLVGDCGPHSEVCIRRLGQPWQPFDLAQMDQQTKDSPKTMPFFLNDSTLALANSGRMAVATVEGKLLFTINLSSRYGIGARPVSGGADRFAIIETTMRGVTIRTLDMYAFPADDHLVVYSLDQRVPIYARKLRGTSPWSPWAPHKNRIALSRDRILLAVLDDGILALYQLPQ